MRHLLFILIFCSVRLYSQEIDSAFLKFLWAETDSLLVKSPEENYKINFSPLWLTSDPKITHGFIGENYQRIDIVILSVSRSKSNNNEYTITGKSKVKNNICFFKGTMTVSQIYIFEKVHYGVDDEYKGKGIKQQGIVISKYVFYEDSTLKHSGVFEGTIASKWYLDNDYELKYDDTEIASDGYWNNAFVGTWKSYKETSPKICNWGDHRILNCGDLDIGAGEFSPNEKYFEYSWQNYHDAYINNDPNARQIEETKWW